MTLNVCLNVLPSWLSLSSKHVILIDQHPSLLTHYQLQRRDGGLASLKDQSVTPLRKANAAQEASYQIPPPLRRVITDLVRVQCEVGPQQAARVSVVVVLHLVHVVRWVPDLHIYASVGHGLPLDTLAPEESRLVNNTTFISPQF